MGIAHIAAVGRQLVGQAPIGRAAVHILPGAEMQLVNAHGAGHEVKSHKPRVTLPKLCVFAPHPLGVVGGDLATMLRQKQAVFRL